MTLYRPTFSSPDINHPSHGRMWYWLTADGRRILHPGACLWQTTSSTTDAVEAMYPDRPDPSDPRCFLTRTGSWAAMAEEAEAWLVYAGVTIEDRPAGFVVKPNERHHIEVAT